MQEQIEWAKYFNFDKEKNIELLKSVGAKKIYAMALMPIRGPHGFRKLDYEFAEKKLEVNEIMNKVEDSHFNVFGLVIKDTDGACVWDTEVGWNPTNRDILGEFCDAGKDRNIKIMVAFTSMNDAYQGYLHPERVSIHGRNGEKLGKKYKKGDVSTHNAYEMRVDLPEGVTLEEYQKKIPFLTNEIDLKIGKSRDSRGFGYIPTESFMCPNSAHVDYLLGLIREVVKDYPIKAFTADYIRYDGHFTDLCACSRCVSKFKESYGHKSKLLKGNKWYEFKTDTIANYAQKLQKTVKNIDNTCLTGWYSQVGPKKLVTIKRHGQNWTKLSSILDISIPMEYPYLAGTRDDGFFWGKVGDLFFWYYLRNMKKRAHEYKGPVLAVTNSVECNVKEMLKQMKSFDFGLGIALFKYFGTTDDQWRALKEYAENELGLENLKFNQ
ncbi:MAG: hypothetical protein ACFE78_03430 [Candidatus Hodarchaeota archaeon]